MLLTFAVILNLINQFVNSFVIYFYLTFIIINFADNLHNGTIPFSATE